MSIKYVVLGLLAERPRHGYAVRAAFEERIGDWAAPGSAQVYQVLAALEEEGLAVATIDRTGRRRRRVYAVSEKGRNALRRWAVAAPGERDRRTDLFVRLLFACADEGLVAEILSAQARHEASTLARLRSARHARSDPAALVRRLQIEAEIRAAETALEVISLCRWAFDRLRTGAAIGEILDSLSRLSRR